MQIRVTVAPDGKTQVETISALEDLWHDHLFFRLRGSELDQPSATPTDRLVAKRYYRAALLTLVCYFEGVLNRWLKQLLGQSDWRKAERQRIEKKVDLIQSRSSGVQGCAPDIGGAKKLRNMLVHLKPGADGDLYDKINRELLQDAHKQIDAWLTEVGASLQLRRHPDTRAESRTFTEAIGTSIPQTEGYTGEEK
jgi:hypothetical protein